MTPHHQFPLTPAIVKAIDEIKGLIAGRFPQATFSVGQGFEPVGIFLVATVDVEDTDEVVDVYGDRLVDIQVEEGLPLYVTPLRPRARVFAELRAQEAGTPLPV